MEERNLQAIDGATLMGLRLEPTRFCVDTLLPQGVCFLGGASKIGKSWMVLDWCVRIAKGEPVWGLPTQKGTTLYLCLEDTLRRVQDRLNRITDEVPGNAYFSAQAETMAGGLLEEIRRFVGQHPDTVLVAVDTFAVVRALGGDQTYGSDYQEVRQLKALADELEHHFADGAPRPQAGGQRPSQPALRHHGHCGGAADTVLILERSRRSADCATFYATGRDTEYREMELRFHRETCSWELLSDSLGAAGKAIAPGDAVPDGLYEKGENLQGRQRRLRPSLQPVRRDAAHRQGAETADEAVAVLPGGPGSALCEPSQQRPPVGGGVLHLLPVTRVTAVTQNPL